MVSSRFEMKELMFFLRFDAFFSEVGMKFHTIILGSGLCVKSARKRAVLAVQIGPDSDSGSAAAFAQHSST